MYINICVWIYIFVYHSTVILSLLIYLYNILLRMLAKKIRKEDLSGVRNDDLTGVRNEDLLEQASRHNFLVARKQPS